MCFLREQLKLTYLCFHGPDIDECAEGIHNCSGTCVNAVGTFRCVDREPVSCGLGFRYDAEKRECQGKQAIHLSFFCTLSLSKYRVT